MPGKRGPRTPGWMEQRIGQLFLALSRQNGLEPTGKEVHAALLGELRKQATQEERSLDENAMPSVRKVQDVLTKMRDGLRGLLEQERELDARWSLGTGAKLGIPPENNKALLDVWRWCLAVGRTFTNREAWWVSRLVYVLAKEVKPGLLYRYAYRYALTEQADDALGKPSTTIRWDAVLALPDGEYNAAVAMGVFVYDADTGMPGEPVGAWAGWEVEDQLRLSHSGELGRDADLIYAWHLRIVSERDTWSGLSKEQRQGVADGLHAYAQAQAARPDASTTPTIVVHLTESNDEANQTEEGDHI